MNLTTLSVAYTESTQEPTTTEFTEPSRIFSGKFTITNMEFTPELADSFSESFKELARNLEQLLNDVFDEISGFLYVKVASFARGSIVCNFFIYTEVGSSATVDEFENALTAAANYGNTSNYQISNIEVQEREQEDVGAVKRKKPEDKFPLQVIAVAAFVGVVALIIVFVLYKVSVCRSLLSSCNLFFYSNRRSMWVGSRKIYTKMFPQRGKGKVGQHHKSCAYYTQNISNRRRQLTQTINQLNSTRSF